MADLSVRINRLKLKNPVMTASGTFGYGLEYADFVSLDQIGGIIVKGTTLQPREGNDYPRMAETTSGMLNCVGLQNKGVDYFCEHIYPQIKDIDTNMIVNVSGSSPENYAECAARIDKLDKIPAIELNISCPNVKQGGMAFGTTCSGAASVVKAVRQRYNKTLIVKLSPNVTNIAEIAKACEAEGADSVSLINTLMGMAIDIEKRQPMLSIATGGLSGPAVKPVAVRMVWQVAKAVKIPVIGLGGICNAADAIEFMMAGATAIQIGTANFLDPTVTIKVRDGINEWLDRHVCQRDNRSARCLNRNKATASTEEKRHHIIQRHIHEESRFAPYRAMRNGFLFIPLFPLGGTKCSFSYFQQPQQQTYSKGNYCKTTGGPFGSTGNNRVSP